MLAPARAEELPRDYYVGETGSLQLAAAHVPVGVVVVGDAAAVVVVVDLLEPADVDHVSAPYTTAAD